MVTVTNVLQGAHLSLLVDRQLRPDSLDVYPESLTDPAVIPVSGPPLTVGQHVLVVQQFCSMKSSTDGPGVPVVKGNLKVTVTPEPVVRGTTTQVHVDATDTATGVAVGGLTVTFKGQQVGVTPASFSYSPALGESDPTGTVDGGNEYNSVNFTITLVDPFWTLSMHAGPVPIIISNQQTNSFLKTDITNITWLVEPDFPATGFPKTISVTPTPPNVITNVQLPIPTGNVNMVKVTLSGTASTQGGTLNNVIIPPGSGMINPTDPQTVAHNSSTETISWVLTVSLQTDQHTGGYDLYVIPMLQGIGP